MRIGTYLPPSDSPTSFVDRAARAHGVDSIWTSQLPGSWDPLSLLASLGPAGPAEVGTSIVPTYPRHPVVAATEALTVQALTGGRLTLGLGPSHETLISGQFGIPYAAPARHTREYLEVLRPLLRGEHVRHSGEFFTVDTGLQVTAPPPPVLISALGPRMLEVARDLADGTIATWVRPDTVAGHLVPRIGPGRRVVVSVVVAVTADPDGVREGVARDFGAVADMPAYRAVLDRGGLSGPADTVVAGSEEAVARELRHYRDAGTTDLMVHPLGDPDARERAVGVALDVRGELAPQGSRVPTWWPGEA